MKKIIEFFFLCFMLSGCFLLFQSGAISVSAVEFSVRSEYDHEDSTAYYYKVFVSVQDGADISIGGFSVHYNGIYFEPVVNNAGDPIIEKYGNFLQAGTSVANNTDDFLVGIGFMGSSYLTEDEDILSFTIKSKNKSLIDNNPSLGNYIVTSMEIDRLGSSNTVMLSDEELEAATPTYVEALYYRYVVGSIAATNGTQTSSLEDAQRLQAIVSALGPISVDATLTQSQINALQQATYPGLYIDTTDFDTIIVLEVADIDGDGDVDQDDADELLHYYVRVEVMHMAPPAGTRVGTTESVYHIIQLT